MIYLRKLYWLFWSRFFYFIVTITLFLSGKRNYFYGEFFLTVLHLVRQKYGPVFQKDIADIGQ